MFDGVEFTPSEPGEGGLPAWVDCTIHRKDRRVATSVREYMQEARQPYGAWLSQPARMLRDKALVHCARVCFALVSMLDLDEAVRVARGRDTGYSSRQAAKSTQRSESPWAPIISRSGCRGLVFECHNLLFRDDNTVVKPNILAESPKYRTRV